MSDAGNTLATATSLNITSTLQTWADSVSPSDVNDYYRFVLPYRSSLNLSLSGLTANANVQLLNGSGGLIQESANQGALAESLNTTLEAGVYYVRVFPATAGITTNYSLRKCL
jgi:hypothetical protein